MKLISEDLAARMDNQSEISTWFAQRQKMTSQFCIHNREIKRRPDAKRSNKYRNQWYVFREWFRRDEWDVVFSKQIARNKPINKHELLTKYTGEDSD